MPKLQVKIMELATKGECVADIARTLKVSYYVVKRVVYPEKLAANQMVLAAVKSGELIRPERCEQCRKSKFIHGHHPDYSKPLEVEWLCTACHASRHSPTDKRKRFYDLQNAGVLSKRATFNNASPAELERRWTKYCAQQERVEHHDSVENQRRTEQKCKA